MQNIGTNLLYKYVSVETLHRVLESGLRFTQPGAFNDPYEFLPELIVPKGDRGTTVSMSFDLTSPRRAHGSAQDVAVPDGYDCSDYDARQIVDVLNRQIGVLCLSRNSESLLMWAHYADQYKGALIAFDATHPFFEGQIDVEYCERRPRKNLQAFTHAGTPIPIAELCAKSDVWKYEDEVRVVRSLNDCREVSVDGMNFPVFVRALPPECIKEVILGERSPVADQRSVWELVKDTKIQLALAAVANWGFEFRKEIVKFAVPYPKMQPILTPRTAHIFSDRQDHLGEMARWAIRDHPLSTFVNRTA